ncbi:M13 family metallopeptidase [Blautia schinkii]|nr:M13 family metallopeptidase [Blautia schinkii]
MKMKPNIRVLAMCLSLIMFFSTCFSVLAAAQTDTPATVAQLTLRQLSDYLITAADDYNNTEHTSLLEGIDSDEDANATKIQAMVMISRAFGTLPEPKGSNALLAPDAVNLDQVPEWARADLDNLNQGGVLTDSDLESSDTVSLSQVETVVRRIWSLFGTNPRDDFYAYVNKTALEQTAVPTGELSAGGSDTVALETNEKVRNLILEIVESETDYPYGSNEQKMRDFYRSILAPRSGGTELLKPWFESIDSAGSLSGLRDVQLTIIDRLGASGNGLLPFSLSSDLSDPDKKVLNLLSGFMVMTLEDYENPDSEAHREYRSGLINDMQETGETQETAEALADAVIALELEQLKYGMTAEEASDIKNYNNLLSMDELDSLMPELAPKTFLTALGFSSSIDIQTYDIKALRILASHMTEEELPRIKVQVKLNLLYNTAFMLSGEASPEEALDEVSTYLSTEVGQLYVQRYFPPEAKDGLEELVNSLISAFEKRISALDWMDDTTKQEALRKLNTLTVLIGYPDEWPENKYEIKAPENGGSYFENMSAIDREQLRQTVEKQNGGGNTFDLPAFMVNAAANRQTNTLVFPAGILQPPFYDPNASIEENLGGIGAVIAHEITHTFDDQGAQYDADGVVRDWWSPEDYEHFQKLCEKAREFYHGTEAAPGITIDGEMTLSENIADIGGVACALEVLSGMENPDYDAFFRAFAKRWLLVTDRDNTAMLADTDEHAPKKLRVDQVLKNFREFYDTYNIQPGDGMYVEPENRINIW